MPIELPTRNVAGSPTSVSRPAELLMIAASIIGGTKSMSSAFATPMMMGASSTTVVAFGSRAHSGATSTKRSREALAAAPVARR